MSYTKNDWNLSATLIYGIDFNQFVPSRPQVSPCTNPTTGMLGGCNPDWLSLDLTATYKWANGNWDRSDLARGI